MSRASAREILLLMASCLVLYGCSDPVAKQIDRAILHFEEGEGEDARRLALELARQPPDDPEEVLRLSRLLLDVGEPKAAIPLLEDAKAGPEGRELLAYAYLLGGRKAEAERLLAALKREGRVSGRTRTVDGLLLAGGGRLPDASAELTRAIQEDPADPLPYAFLARIQRQMRDFPASERTLRRARTRLPDSPEIMAELGAFLLATRPEDTGSAREAADLLREATRRRPLDRGSRTNLGIALRRLERFAEAEAVFADLVEEKPDDLEGWLNLGAIRLERGEPDRARLALERARSLAPGHPLVLVNLGNAWLELSDLAADQAERNRRLGRAREAFEAAREADGRLADAFVGLARTRVKESSGSDAVEAAVPLYLTAIRLDPDSFPAHLNLALLYYDLWANPGTGKGESFQLAMREFRRAEELVPPEQWDPHARKAFEELKER